MGIGSIGVDIYFCSFKMYMKKFILIILMLFYVVVLLGIMINFYYCMGCLVDVEWGSVFVCVLCGEKKMILYCCKDEVYYVKLVVDQDVNYVLVINLLLVVIELLFVMYSVFILLEVESLC